jgi:Fic family protein
MVKPSHRKAEKVARRRAHMEQSDADMRAYIDGEIAKETRPESVEKWRKLRANVGKGREKELAEYEAGLESSDSLSIANTIGLLLGSVRQLADKLDAANDEIAKLKGGS